jgi:hypothetical protein
VPRPLAAGTPPTTDRGRNANDNNAMTRPPMATRVVKTRPGRYSSSTSAVERAGVPSLEMIGGRDGQDECRTDLSGGLFQPGGQAPFVIADARSPTPSDRPTLTGPPGPAHPLPGRTPPADQTASGAATTLVDHPTAASPATIGKGECGSPDLRSSDHGPVTNLTGRPGGITAAAPGPRRIRADRRHAAVRPVPARAVPGVRRASDG